MSHRSKSIGPLLVRDKNGQLIGHMYQSRESKLWTAYNKRPETVWRSFGPTTRAASRKWLNGPQESRI